MLHVVRREPSSFGVQRARWTLKHLLLTCEGLRLTSSSGLWRLLERLGISYQRARDYVRSPDPHYEQKLA